MIRLLGAACALVLLPLAPAASAAQPQPRFDDAASRALHLDSAGGRVSYRDGHGREVVLRGFNVSGEVKLGENGNLPFASVAEARESAAALRDRTGANTVRFLLSWERVQPAPDRIDYDYLRRATEQLAAFADEGFWVLPDYHQDLYSRHLFRPDSWYTGDGAPRWVIEAGGYPPENCGVCLHWGQNMMNNQAIKQAKADFWHNRRLPTPSGEIGVQDAFFAQAEAALGYLSRHLSPAQFQRVIGFDPMNEPSAGEYDDGQDSASWERDLLWPFFERFRSTMDRAGWREKPAYAEPTVFWNNNVPFVAEEGGFQALDRLGTRYVFNAHFYHALAQSGLHGKAGDGENTAEFAEIRDRAADLGTTGFVSEFGHPLGGSTADKFPTVMKGIYQGMDSRLAGADWWRHAAESGPVLSGTQWQWDIYHDRHHEQMNGNPKKVRTEADAWNGEDFSLVGRDEAGTLRLRADARLVDRLYPRAVDGSTTAFTYEDRSRDGDETLTWNEIPANMPAVRELIGDGQYGVLAWRDGGSAAPTELHLPGTFDRDRTAVVSDLGAVHGIPAYSPEATISSTEDSRLLLNSGRAPGTLHYALIANGVGTPSPERLDAARAELAAWSSTLR